VSDPFLEELEAFMAVRGEMLTRDTLRDFEVQFPNCDPWLTIRNGLSKGYWVLTLMDER
jgi:hypothetical protein